jgi:hypothetical protein
MEVIMKHLYLLFMLVISSISFGQVAPGDGAFTTFHVKAENPNEYIDFLKKNSQLLGAQNPDVAGTCVTRSGNRYMGEMFVWSAYGNMEDAMENANSFDPYTSPRALQKLRTPMYSSFWKPLKPFVLNPGFERVTRVVVQPEDVQEYVATMAALETAIKKTNPDFELGVFQSFGGGEHENTLMVRGLARSAGEHGGLVDQFFAGQASWAPIYQKLLAMAETVSDSYEDCQIIYTK